MREPQEESRELPCIFLELSYIELVAGVTRLMMEVGICMTSVKSPSPQEGGIQAGTKKRKMIGGRIDLGHYVAGESIVH